MFSLFKKTPKERPEDRERSRIYVRPTGAIYVKADELLRSKRGRKAVKEMADLFGNKRRSRLRRRRRLAHNRAM